MVDITITINKPSFINQRTLNDALNEMNFAEIGTMVNNMAHNIKNVANIHLTININYKAKSANAKKSSSTSPSTNTLINSSNNCAEKIDKVTQIELASPIKKNIATQTEQRIEIQHNPDEVDASDLLSKQTKHTLPTKHYENQGSKSTLNETPNTKKKANPVQVGRVPPEATLGSDTLPQSAPLMLHTPPALQEVEQKTHIAPFSSNKENTTDRAKQSIEKKPSLISNKANKMTLPILANTQQREKQSNDFILNDDSSRAEPTASYNDNPTLSHVKEIIQKIEQNTSSQPKVTSQINKGAPAQQQIASQTTESTPAITNGRTLTYAEEIQTSLSSYSPSRTASQSGKLSVVKKTPDSSLALVPKNASRPSTLDRNTLPSLALSEVLRKLLSDNTFKSQMKNSALNKSPNKDSVENMQVAKEAKLLSSMFNNIEDYFANEHNKKTRYRYTISIDNFEVIITISPKDCLNIPIEGQNITNLLANYITGLNSHNIFLNVLQRNFDNNAFSDTDDQDDDLYSVNDPYIDEEFSDMEDIQRYDDDLFYEIDSDIFSEEQNQAALEQMKTQLQASQDIEQQLQQTNDILKQREAELAIQKQAHKDTEEQLQQTKENLKVAQTTLDQKQLELDAFTKQVQTHKQAFDNAQAALEQMKNQLQASQEALKLAQQQTESQRKEAQALFEQKQAALATFTKQTQTEHSKVTQTQQSAEIQTESDKIGNHSGFTNPSFYEKKFERDIESDDAFSSNEENDYDYKNTSFTSNLSKVQNPISMNKNNLSQNQNDTRLSIAPVQPENYIHISEEISKLTTSKSYRPYATKYNNDNDDYNNDSPQLEKKIRFPTTNTNRNDFPEKKKSVAQEKSLYPSMTKTNQLIEKAKLLSKDIPNKTNYRFNNIKKNLSEMIEQLSEVEESKIISALDLAIINKTRYSPSTLLADSLATDKKTDSSITQEKATNTVEIPTNSPPKTEQETQILIKQDRAVQTEPFAVAQQKIPAKMTQGIQTDISSMTETKKVSTIVLTLPNTIYPSLEENNKTIPLAQTKISTQKATANATKSVKKTSPTQNKEKLICKKYKPSLLTQGLESYMTEEEYSALNEIKKSNFPSNLNEEESILLNKIAAAPHDSLPTINKEQYKMLKQILNLPFYKNITATNLQQPTLISPVSGKSGSSKKRRDDENKEEKDKHENE
ncbi:hypothetical protein [Providencia manganoxydans]|uniref:hypothetical protein n=1 Tax=Providencia manganoxydans TaxID=2923283 RepID=UPI0034DD254E